MAQSTSAASPAPFTFASPVSFSSETHEDALDLDYESWIQQSKIANCYSNKRLWMDDAEAEVINRHHQEMMLRVADNLPEEAYELSLRDITELSLPPPPPPPTRARSLPCRHKSTPSIIKPMEGAGSFIIKLFMPSPSRAASSGGARNKSFSGSSMTVSVLRKKSALANHGRSPSMENDTYSNGYHGSTKRNPMSCYPFFNSSKYKAKHKFTGNQGAAIHSSFHASAGRNTDLQDINEVQSTLQFKAKLTANGHFCL